GVLAEMARQPLHLADERDEQRNARRVGIDAARAELRRELVVVVAVAVYVEELHQAVDLLERETERLPGLAHRAPRTVTDDGRGHRRAALPVAAIDVLDHFLPMVARGQVEIDVGPLAALLGEEALEEESHADRVDGGDAERIADRAVGGRTAS